jgi:hypothetical protein
VPTGRAARSRRSGPCFPRPGAGPTRRDPGGS